MCVAVPAEILAIFGDGWARAAVGGNEFDVNVKLVDCAVGDRVLVHAGCAVGVVDDREAAEIDALLAEIYQIEN